jgi:hypothetical protein
MTTLATQCVRTARGECVGGEDVQGPLCPQCHDDHGADVTAPRYTLDAPVVRVGMTSSAASELSELLLAWPDDVSAQAQDQLWLLVVLTEQRRRTPIAERPRYDEQANHILAMLDPPRR